MEDDTSEFLSHWGLILGPYQNCHDMGGWEGNRRASRVEQPELQWPCIVPICCAYLLVSLCIHPGDKRRRRLSSICCKVLPTRIRAGAEGRSGAV